MLIAVLKINLLCRLLEFSAHFRSLSKNDRTDGDGDGDVDRDVELGGTKESWRPEMSMGPFCVTRCNSTHQMTDSTQHNPVQVGNFKPNPIQLTNLTACCNQIFSNRALNTLS